MRILVVGSGGREHALVWKISKSGLADKIFCAPGNGGISQQAECLDIKAEDIPALLDFAKREKIDFTVVGPEIPLSLGIVDEFQNYGLKIFGPNRQGAKLESSKVFAKQLMAKYNVPTPDFKIFDNPEEADRYIEIKGAPCVVKADGLAAGKGVVVAKTAEEAKDAVNSIMRERIFGDSGKRVIIEECLEGQEASILVFTDSKGIAPLASSQDHKRIFDKDKGPNTGGMGAYSPAPIVTPEVFKEIMDRIISPIIYGMNKEGINYKGVLYAGVMLTKTGPKVLEFNVRFGDPETQAILPRLKSDLLEVMLATVDEKLSNLKTLMWDNRACVCVVIASGGYPGHYEKGKEIFGLDEAQELQDIMVFHAGTKKFSADNSKFIFYSNKFKAKYVTDGGRVLGVAGLGNTIKEAIDKTYKAVGKISFSGMHYRRDIGQKAAGIK